MRYTAGEQEGNVLIAGNFNARVGALQESDAAPARGCTDEIVTARGHQLLRLCQDTGSSCIGRTMGDESAVYSLRPSARGPGSRLDHVVVPTALPAGHLKHGEPAQKGLRPLYPRRRHQPEHRASYRYKMQQAVSAQAPLASISQSPPL